MSDSNPRNGYDDVQMERDSLERQKQEKEVLQGLRTSTDWDNEITE